MILGMGRIQGHNILNQLVFEGRYSLLLCQFRFFLRDPIASDLRRIAVLGLAVCRLLFQFFQQILRAMITTIDHGNIQLGTVQISLVTPRSQNGIKSVFYRLILDLRALQGFFSILVQIIYFNDPFVFVENQFHRGIYVQVNRLGFHGIEPHGASDQEHTNQHGGKGAQPSDIPEGRTHRAADGLTGDRITQNSLFQIGGRGQLY